MAEAGPDGMEKYGMGKSGRDFQLEAEGTGDQRGKDQHHLGPFPSLRADARLLLAKARINYREIAAAAPAD